MASLSKYFIKDDNCTIARKDTIFQGLKYRITILTERLVRLEYNEKGIFEDRPTQLVINRNFEKPVFSVKETNNSLEIKTKYFTLNYAKEKPFKGSKLMPGKNLTIRLRNSERFWYYNHPEVRNFGGTNISLDEDNKLQNGLFSMDGFVTLDDSKNLVINNDEYVKREKDLIDIYVFLYRKDFGLCLRDYYALTGMPSMIPRYALGNFWSKDESYTEEEVLDIANKFKINQIPLSVILLRNKWHDNLSNYNFSSSLFNNPKEMISKLNEEGIILGLTVNPNNIITNKDINYNNIKTLLSVNDGKQVNLIPFSNKTLAIYFKILIKNLEDIGINLFNIDYYNKKDLNDMWLATHYHYANSNKGEALRGLVMARNSMIAAHRYPILYSGNTKVSWETLNKLPFYNLSSSNMGISWWAHAIGGYLDGTEDGELFMRYVQFGTYSPIMMLASEGGKYYKREPWKWNASHLVVIRDYMQLRQRLIPYIYSEGYVYYKTGLPLVQPLYYKYPVIYDEPVYKNEYYFGSQLLVAPITYHKEYLMDRVIQKLYIPEGMWYDFKTGKKFPGNHYYISFYKDEDYPVFCKAGGIVVLSNDYMKTALPTNLEIHIFPGMSNTYKLYEDDGITNLYKENYYLLTSIDYNYRSNNYTVIIRPLDGKTGIVPPLRNYKIRFRNTKKADDVIVYTGENKIDAKSYVDGNDFILEIENVSTTEQLTINCKGKDIEIDATRVINEEIISILSDVKIETKLKIKIESIFFSNLSIKKKRIGIKKLKKDGLDKNFIKMFIKLLEYISEI